MIGRAINFIEGWSVGYQHGDAKTQADASKQGKNYYIAAVHQSLQIATLGNIISELSGRLSLACSACTLISLPAGLYLASLRTGDNRIVHFLTENTAGIVRIATISAAVATFAMGNYFYSGGVIATLIYDVIDNHGLVPREISLFVEDYLPKVPMMNLMLASPPWLRIAFVALTPALYTPIYRGLQQKIDRIVTACLRLNGPRLSEIEKPMEDKRNMSFAEMDLILEGSDAEYEIDPSHCSKLVGDLSPLPEDRDFNKFLGLFDRINWSGKYALVKAKLKDDDRFMDFMKEQFPGRDEDVLRAGFDHFLSQISSANNMTREQYAAHWIRLQMVDLVSMLKGEKRVVGSQQDLDIALDYLAKILPQLNVDHEDSLLQLAVEGGNYCSKGIKRVASELVPKWKDYDQKLRQSLQDVRSRILQHFYDTRVNWIKDIQSFDLYREYASYGFYPLADSERDDFCMCELGVWELFSEVRGQMYAMYHNRLDEAIRENGEVNFGIYMRRTIEDNTALSREQKDILLDKYTGGRWSPEETNRRFHRLGFVMLNVLRRKMDLR